MVGDETKLAVCWVHSWSDVGTCLTDGAPFRLGPCEIRESVTRKMTPSA